MLADGGCPHRETLCPHSGPAQPLTPELPQLCKIALDPSKNTLSLSPAPGLLKMKASPLDQEVSRGIQRHYELAKDMVV